MTELPILPAFSENNVAITMQSSDFFAPYASVTIRSILDHITAGNNYDFIITSKDMSEESAATLCAMADPYSNVSIRVVNVKKIYDQLIQVEDKRFGGETVTRIFLMELLPDYDKVLNLDSDMIVCADVAELYATDITDYYMAAVQDLQSYISYCYGYKKVYFNRSFVKDTLKLNSITDYYNGGLLLLNLERIRESFGAKKIAETIIRNNFRFFEQDAFSHLFRGSVLSLDWKWNWQCDANTYFQDHVGEIYDFAGYREKFKFAQKYPCIVHYLSEIKPWANEKTIRATLWWQYAGQSPFYGSILGRRYQTMKYASTAERVLFVCETPYHLFNSLEIKHQLYKNVPADIVFTASADFSAYISQLEKIKLFDTIYRTGYTVVKDIAKLRETAPNREITKHPERYEHYIDLSAEYSDYFMPVLSSPYQKLLYLTLKKKGKAPRVHLYEDGAITYIEDVQRGMQKDTLYYGAGDLTRFQSNLCEILVRNPSLYLADSQNVPVAKLPDFRSDDCEMWEIMQSVFGEQCIPKERFIFFNEPFSSEGLLSNDVDILETIAQRVGKDNVTVKLHPRAAREREKYISRGFKIYENNTPWETVFMNPEIENKVLLSISSNSLVTPWSVGGKKPLVVYLWKVMKLSQRHHVREAGFSRFLSAVAEEMNSEGKKMFCPNSMSELTEIIKYVEGESK